MNHKSKHFAILACIGMVIPTAAVAQTAPQATATTPTVKQTVAAKPRVVCTEEEVTGSKFTKRICTTVQARAERRQDDQDFLKQAQTPGFDSGH